MPATLPHARIEGRDRLFGMFRRLNRPIHFDSVDGNPVDLVFLLLIPPAAGSEHLDALARLVLELIGGLDDNASRTRQLRRLFRQHLGASPVAVALQIAEPFSERMARVPNTNI